MKKAFIVTAILSTLGTTALAANTFDGPYAALSMGLVNKQTNVNASLSDSMMPNTYDNQTSSKNSVMGQALLGYSYSFAEKFNISANVFTQFGSNNAGTDTNAIEGANSSEIRYKLKNVWGISIEPGIYLADKTLAYAKLGVAKGKSSRHFSVNGANAVVSDSFNRTGFLYGIGVKHMLTSNVYVGLEVQKIDFSGKTTVSLSNSGTETRNSKLSQLSGAVSIGYQF